MKTVKTSQLNIGYFDHGPENGWVCILNHGFPYDIHCYNDCIDGLIQKGARVLVPYLPWQFDEGAFNLSAPAFDNPDFVDVVIHSYRHRFGLVGGDSSVAAIEAKLALQPNIDVPSISIDGDVDGVDRGTAHHANKFTGPHEHRVFKNTGHNIPQENPVGWVQANLDARDMKP